MKVVGIAREVLGFGAGPSLASTLCGGLRPYGVEVAGMTVLAGWSQVCGRISGAAAGRCGLTGGAAAAERRAPARDFGAASGFGRGVSALIAK